MEKNSSLMGGKGENGKWITVNGSHIFVEDGQTIEDAMNKQFKTGKKTSTDNNDSKYESNGDKIVGSYMDDNGMKYHIVQAPNGKYFNEYESSNAGPFESLEEAKKMMAKHRPNATENGGYQGVSNVKDAPKFEYKSDGSNWENGKYTGDQARFNKFHNALSKGKVGEPTTKQMLSEIGINNAGIKNYMMTNELFNTENNPDTSIKIVQRIFNDGDYRK